MNLACNQNIEGEPTPEADGDPQTPLTYVRLFDRYYV